MKYHVEQHLLRMTNLVRRIAATASAYGTWAHAAIAPARTPIAGPAEGPPHLVLLVGTFPPAVDGGVYRPLSFVRHADARGWRVTVLAAPCAPDVDEAGQHLLTQIPDQVTVWRPDGTTARPFGRCFPKVDGSAVLAIEKYRVATRLAQAEPHVVLLATGPSFDNFIMGYYAARQSGRPLILDYRDEWTECPHHFVRPGRFDRGFETRALRAADLVLFPTESMLEHHCQSFVDLDRARCRLVPNGWEALDFKHAGALKTVTLTGDEICISHLGYLGASSVVEDFVVALRALAQRRRDLTDRVRFDFTGKIDETERNLLLLPRPGVNIRIGGQLPKPEALRKMQQGQALLLLGFRLGGRELPGKLFEYVAAGRPVLAFGAGQEVARVVEGLGIGWVIDRNDEHGLEKALEALVDGKGDAVMSKPELRAKWLLDHERERIATRLFDMIEEMVVNPPPTRVATASRMSTLARSRISRGSRRRRETRALRSMQRSGHGMLQAVVSSVKPDREMSKIERTWVRKIEALRSALEASMQQISVVDHGAGSPEESERRRLGASRLVESETIGSITRRASKPLPWCLFLFRVVRSIKPKTCIELGTAVGISAAYQSAALACNGRGQLVTLEGSSALAGVARDNLSRLGLDRAGVELGRFQDILHPILARLGSVDFAYVDGHHEKNATVAYCHLILEHMSDGVIVLDDIDWSPGMREAWESICGDSRVSYCVDVASGVGSMGVVVVDRDVAGRRRFRVRLAARDQSV